MRWFSRTKPPSDDRKADGSGDSLFSESRFLENVADGVAVKTMADVPGGRYRHFDSFSPNIDLRGGKDGYLRDNFAIIELSPRNFLLLHTAANVVSRERLAMVSRLKIEGGGSQVTVRPAAASVIKALGDQAKSDREQMFLSGEKETDIESKAWALFEAATKAGASDVHIETRGAEAQVLFRIFGERIPQAPMAATTAVAIMATLFNVHSDSQNSGTNWKPTEVQDTSVDHTFLVNGTDQLRVQLRLNTTPIFPSPNVQMTARILRMDAASGRPLAEVGYSPKQVAAIESMLVGSGGLVLLVGPTNSGKSTSMQAFIASIYARRGTTIKVATIEDPVEYVIARACQHGIPRGTKSDTEIKAIYYKFLASLLRQDCDVGTVGEIRTNEQAEPIKDLVLAGRKILSTLHVYEALAVFDRLAELGVPMSVMCREGFLSGVIYQRLVPTLCPSCSVPLTDVLHLPAAELASWIDPETLRRTLAVVDTQAHNVRLRSRTGCEVCKGMGIVGRTPCAEILRPTEDFLALVRKGDSSAAREWWLANGVHNDDCGVNAVGHGIVQMRRGLISPMDLESQIGMIQIARPRASVGASTFSGSALDMLTAGRMGMGS